MTVVGVNDEPEGIDGIIATHEDQPLTFNTTDFGFTDVDNDDLLSVIIDTPPQTGRLELSGTPVASGDVVPAALLTNLVYTPPLNSNLNIQDTIKFRVQDNGGSDFNGTDTDSTGNTLKINVLPVNDAPYSADKIINVVEDSVYTFNACLLYTSDAADE